MAQPTHDRQDVLKQNFELTLIIIFIGLAFGLVGLVVPTAAVMSVVVVSIGVIVGFVSYRDAFIPQLTSQMTVSTPVPQKLPIQMRVATPVTQKVPTYPSAPKLTQTPAPSTAQQPAPTPHAPVIASKPEQKPAPQTRLIEETLPRLPKIQRLPESGGATFPSQAKPLSPSPPTASSPRASEPTQAKDTKPRKIRARKTVEVPNLDDEKKA